MDEEEMNAAENDESFASEVVTVQTAVSKSKNKRKSSLQINEDEDDDNIIALTRKVPNSSTKTGTATALKDKFIPPLNTKISKPASNFNNNNNLNSSASNNVRSMFKDETRMDRIIRLVSNLKQTSDPSCIDEIRALKIMVHCF
jgi:hypothetical protein